MPGESDTSLCDSAAVGVLTAAAFPLTLTVFFAVQKTSFSAILAMIIAGSIPAAAFLLPAAVALASGLMLWGGVHLWGHCRVHLFKHFNLRSSEQSYAELSHLMPIGGLLVRKQQPTGPFCFTVKIGEDEGGHYMWFIASDSSAFEPAKRLAKSVKKKPGEELTLPAKHPDLIACLSEKTGPLAHYRSMAAKRAVRGSAVGFMAFAVPLLLLIPSYSPLVIAASLALAIFATGVLFALTTPLFNRAPGNSSTQQSGVFSQLCHFFRGATGDATPLGGHTPNLSQKRSS